MDNETTYTYILMRKLPRKNNRKTDSFQVVNVHGGHVLGCIEWYGPWRQLCFFPTPNTVWNRGCLCDIQDFLARLQVEMKGNK